MDIPGNLCFGNAFHMLGNPGKQYHVDPWASQCRNILS